MKRLVFLCLAFGMFASNVQAGVATSGTLFYSKFAVPVAEDNIWRVDFTYDGVTTFGLSNITAVTKTPDADGLIFLPSGNLLTAGRTQNAVYERTTTGATPVPGSATTNPQGAFHLMVNPTNAVNSAGNVVWVTEMPGAVVSVPLTAGGSLTGAGGTTHATTVDGLTSGVTSIAFDASGNAYFTKSGSSGTGSFGRLNLNTFAGTTTGSGVNFAHGLAFDPYTGNLIMVGNNQIAQVSTAGGMPTIATITLAGTNWQLDHVKVDGNGHLFAASNDGTLVFIDYSASGIISGAGSFLATAAATAPGTSLNLDDIALLPPPEQQNLIPEPTSMIAWAGMLVFASGAAYRRRRMIA